MAFCKNNRASKPECPVPSRNTYHHVGYIEVQVILDHSQSTAKYIWRIFSKLHPQFSLKSARLLKFKSHIAVTNNALFLQVIYVQRNICWIPDIASKLATHPSDAEEKRMCVGGWISGRPEKVGCPTFSVLQIDDCKRNALVGTCLDAMISSSSGTGYS